MKSDSKYYVYAYFDPRNYEMLYVGKGRGSRKYAHLHDKSGSAKERRIHEIKRAGLEPLIRVVASNLTDEQALLVEKALLWRTGESLTNVSGAISLAILGLRILYIYRFLASTRFVEFSL